MERIVNHGESKHSKASERYVDVTFNYDDGGNWSGSIPIEYRRTGIDLSEPSQINDYLDEVYNYCHPNNHLQWQQEQEIFWSDKSAAVTQSFFDALKTFNWVCVSCQMPSNPNFARRIQDLKEMGYTLATYPSKRCERCDRNKTHLLLVPLPRGGMSGYEVWSSTFRKRIVDLLQGYDAYEGKLGKKDNLLPDHKFPEIRWGNNTRRESLENLTDDEILDQFQLLSNQRNLQKREVCRQCYQTGIRGYPFGIKYYYQGDENWSDKIPKFSKGAEQGCIGCGWYDFEKWRNTLNHKLTNNLSYWVCLDIAA